MAFGLGIDFADVAREFGLLGFKSLDTFVTGFIQDNKYVARPVDLLVLKDGSMLISDDYNGAIYRVSYGNARVAGH